MGLIPTREERVGDDFFDRLADQVEQSCDLDAILALGRSSRPPPRAEPSASSLFPREARPVAVTIGVALDEAFNFYYEDNLDLLRAWGAHLVWFSPLHDRQLPEGLDALYLGGGFPELYARELAANEGMLAGIRQADREGRPIYAECGGLMYLSEGIVDVAGRRFPMVGLVPGWSAMTERRLTLGYRALRALRDTPLLRAGQAARGHEFHWSVLESSLPSENAAYEVVDASVRREGYARANLLASYCHLHFGSNPDLAPHFVRAATLWRSERVERRSGNAPRAEDASPPGAA